MASAFGQIPMRAFSDRRLSAGALRLLACYGYHDRNGRNGRYCYARRSTIARETGIHYRNLNRYDRELVACGYIQVGPNPKDKREKIVRVINHDDLEKEVVNLDDRPEEKVINTDDKNAETVIKPTGQVSDLSAEASPIRDLVKRSEEAPL
ncbi:MAG: hypothetical protein QNJ30_20670 [Kiloniellales bacterium]|nr:hypothetical protein [Kiloniellales bacterium]